MEEVIKAIEATKEIIIRQLDKGDTEYYFKSFDGYQRCYGSTNENIKDTFNLFDFAGRDSALTVQASGDQTFNLRFKGINNIDTFDSNKLTEYYALGFKRAMILKYDYYSFLAIMKVISEEVVSLEYVTELIIGLLPYMEKKHAFYWKSIADFNYKKQKTRIYRLNLFLMLCNWDDIDNIALANDYLKDEASYELLRKSLGSANITFKCANALNLADVFLDKKYGFIILSNILDYFYKIWGSGWGKEQLLPYVEGLGKMLLPNGTLLLQYIFYYINTKEGINREWLIRNSLFEPQDIGAQVYSLQKINPDSNRIDGIIAFQRKLK